MCSYGNTKCVVCTTCQLRFYLLEEADPPRRKGSEWVGRRSERRGEDRGRRCERKFDVFQSRLASRNRSICFFFFFLPLLASKDILRPARHGLDPHHASQVPGLPQGRLSSGERKSDPREMMLLHCGTNIPYHLPSLPFPPLPSPLQLYNFRR